MAKKTSKNKKADQELYTAQLLVDTMAIIDAASYVCDQEELEERYEELGDELFSNVDAFELKPFDPDWQEDTVEGYVTHAFTLELPFQVNCRTSPENLTLIFDHLEEYLVDLIDASEMDLLEIWAMKDGQPHLWLNGLRMLDEGRSAESVAQQEEFVRTRLLGCHRPTKRRKRRAA